MLAHLADDGRSLRVLLISGSAHDEDVDAALAMGCVGWIPKPFAADELTSAIERALAGPAPRIVRRI